MSTSPLVRKHQVETVKLADLKFDPQNPNELSDDQIQSLEHSIDKYGYIDPIVVDSDNLVANGEHRARILLNKGVEEIEVIRYDFENDNERKLFRQALNKIHGNHSTRKDISELEILMGYDPNELKSLLNFDETGLDLLRQQMAEQEQEQMLMGQENIKTFDTQPEKRNVEFQASLKHQCPNCGYLFK